MWLNNLTRGLITLPRPMTRAKGSAIAHAGTAIIEIAMSRTPNVGWSLLVAP